MELAVVMPQYKFMVVATWTGHIHPLTTLSGGHTDTGIDTETDRDTDTNTERQKDTDIQRPKT